MNRIYIRHVESNKIVYAIPISGTSPSIQRIEKIISGMIINMDTDKYYVDDSEFDHLYGIDKENAKEDK